MTTSLQTPSNAHVLFYFTRVEYIDAGKTVKKYQSQHAYLWTLLLQE